MTAPIRAIGVRFEAQGVPEVQAASRAVQQAAKEASTRTRTAALAGIEGAADRAREKWGMAGRQIATSMADIGRSGEIGGSALKKFAIVGGEMAVMFSPIGPIASAVALLTLGIVSMFKRARDEQKATQEQFMQGLRDMAAGADYAGLQGQAGKLYRGTFNTKTGQFEGGAKDLLARERALQPTSGFDLGAPGRLKNFYGQKVRSPLDGKEITVRELLAQYAETISVMTMPLSGLAGSRSPITITAGGKADAEARRKEYERRMLDNGYGYSGKIAPRLLTDADKAMFAKLEGKSPLLELWKPDQKQLDKELGETIKSVTYWVTDHISEIAELFKPIGTTIAETIGASLQEGLQGAFETLFTGGGIAQSVRALSQSILRGLGSLFAEIATKAIMMSALMKGFLKSIASMNPWAAGAIAAAMLIAAQALGGAARGAVASAGAGSSVSSAAAASSNDQVTRLVWGADSATVAAGMTPRQAMNVTIIGPNDASAQRAIQELMKNANRRG